MRDVSRRRSVLAVCCTSALLVVMDESCVNVALPAIQRDLDASVSGLQWVVAVYTLVLASMLILSGSTADRIGRRRVFQMGLLIFIAGSLLSSVAPSVGLLVAARALQAVGGSMLNPVAMSIISTTFTKPGERARALGIWGAVVGLALAIGPVLGGVLVDGIGWRSIFWLNIPVGIVVLLLARRFVPESRAARPRPLDPAGQLLVIGALATLTAAAIQGPVQGWGSPTIIGLFCTSATLGVAFVVVELRGREPLIDLAFFRSVPLAGATINAFAAFAALGGFLFLNSLYLQNVRGYTPLHAGLLSVPLAAMLACFAPISGRLVANRGPRISLVLAGIAIAVGAGLLVRLQADTPLAYLLVAYATFGLGAGLVNAPISNSAVSGMPDEQAGLAASIASSSRQVGASLGVAIAGSLVSGSDPDGFPEASHAAWAVIAGCGVVILVVGLASTSQWATRSTDDTRDMVIAR
jgi:EmrB/QacA subfamily drug resistance transporter